MVHATERYLPYLSFFSAIKNLNAYTQQLKTVTSWKLRQIPIAAPEVRNVSDTPQLEQFPALTNTK